jgi:hypothetical protein
MARITTNTGSTQPLIKISTAVNAATGVITWVDANDIFVPCVQDITITNSTGVFAYTAFQCQGGDTRKLTTPADNSISTNVVLDDTTWFGNSYGTSGPVYVANQAITAGLQFIADQNLLIGVRIYWDDADGVGSGKKYRECIGYLTEVAPTVSPEAPVWVSPLSIAVDGSFSDGQNV